MKRSSSRKICVPEGGWIWRVNKRTKVIAPAFELRQGDSWVGDVVSEALARQIVGSVNAAILRNRFGWPSTKQPLDEEGKQIERDIDFWLNYAKGNA